MLQRMAVCSFFYPFGIKEGSKEDYVKVGREQGGGLDYKIVKIMCSPTHGYFEKGI